MYLTIKAVGKLSQSQRQVKGDIMVKEEDITALIERVSIMFEFIESKLSILTFIDLSNKEDSIYFYLSFIQVQKDTKKEILLTLAKWLEEVRMAGNNE
ncbi:MAG: hypothetical protein A2Z98_15800 [Spirochaetes bacterium GWB1_27_13]|nr:MAG: hypothetical protein A2Z98_15800 [Spirochaetes bacterium GWB1_27_13]